ncbi:hypothetical protein WISP_57564 [Willisornis vidua]|uniref:Uncharacterized protein n=1 Tax=Willisornis vidua TaxID=1566151 RepID=A0ABQ9DHR2_9PASS|nr:hypothetical protein WISP_57564 [Willisornis vidua]
MSFAVTETELNVAKYKWCLGEKLDFLSQEAEEFELNFSLFTKHLKCQAWKGSIKNESFGNPAQLGCDPVTCYLGEESDPSPGYNLLSGSCRQSPSSLWKTETKEKHILGLTGGWQLRGLASLEVQPSKNSRKFLQGQTTCNSSFMEKGTELSVKRFKIYEREVLIKPCETGFEISSTYGCYAYEGKT